MSNLARLRSSLRARIHTIEVLLERMTAPVQNLTQSFEYTDTINRINGLTFEENTSMLDIKAEHGSDIDTSKLADFRTSLTNIESRTSATNTNLLTWQASIITANQAKLAHRRN